jgi:hypothetical protein
MKKITTATATAVTMILVSSIELGCVVHERTYSDAVPPPPPQGAPVAASPPPPQAAPPPRPAPGAHPWYLHALSDLRNARANLERKGGDRQMKWDEHEAIVAIDRAIRDLKEASIDDGKNLEEHPPVDAHEPRSGRLHKALAALQAARDDVAKEEDNAYANGLKNRALHDIEEAVRLTDAGVQEVARES